MTLTVTAGGPGPLSPLVGGFSLSGQGATVGLEVAADRPGCSARPQSSESPPHRRKTGPELDPKSQTRPHQQRTCFAGIRYGVSICKRSAYTSVKPPSRRRRTKIVMTATRATKAMPPQAMPIQAAMESDD